MFGAYVHRARIAATRRASPVACAARNGGRGGSAAGLSGGVCRHYSRAYLNHLARAKEILAAILLTTHNLTYYQDLMAEMRSAIEQGRFAPFAEAFRGEQAAGDVEPLPALTEARNPG